MDMQKSKIKRNRKMTLITNRQEFLWGTRVDRRERRKTNKEHFGRLLSGLWEVVKDFQKEYPA